MILRSNDISEGQPINPKFTCDGEDVSPHLAWGDPPKETKSFALSCLDPDAPSGEFAHWLIVNIPAETSDIGQGSIAGQEVQNDFGKKSYGGPCPPSGEHRYIFTLYALDISAIDIIDKAGFIKEVENHQIGQAKIIAPYARKG